MPRELLARTAPGLIPKLLTLQDRNRHSPTYGCFDRNFWHYKIIDFPSGMAQEFVLPLALAHSLDFPDNPYFGEPAIREWAVAGIRFAARAAHADGSSDDYFPYERACGATAFSLLACLDAYEILGLDDPEIAAFLARRADWLAGYHEAGRLTNHQALTALCLLRAGAILGVDRWGAAAAERIERVLEWQNEEGWFQEYEGADPGYHTLTISVLARIEAIRPDERLRHALERAVDFAAAFMHPDGSYGGEYASRNTYNYFPHGFELVGAWLPMALDMNDRFLAGLGNGRAACFADDHIVGHHIWNYLLAWRDFRPVRSLGSSAPAADGRRWFPNAGLLAERRGDWSLFAALNKGGVFALFRGETLLAADSHVSIRLKDGRNAVAHMIGGHDVQLDGDGFRVSGALGFAKQKQLKTFELLVLRLVMLAGGRFFPNLIRRLLQRMLITGKRAAPFRYERICRHEDGGWTVTDTIHADDWSGVQSVALGTGQTSIYVVMSRTYQPGQLLDWTDLTPLIPSDGGPIRHRRRFDP